MILGCFAGFVIDADKLLLIGGSLSLAFATLVLLIRMRLSAPAKVGLIYTHLVSLFFPFIVLTTEVACGAACMPCSNNLVQLAAIALPATLAVSTAAAFFIIPGFYMLFGRKSAAENRRIVAFTSRASRRMRIRAPKIYIIDSAQPVAFSLKSFRPMMFLSAGLLDLLTNKEREAVILHELGHLKRKASFVTTSVALLRIFSPLSLLARFHHDSGDEERYADAVAIRMHKTGRHLASAKRKIDAFEIAQANVGRMHTTQHHGSIRPEPL